MVMEVYLGAVAALAEGGVNAGHLFGLTEQLAGAGRPDLASQIFKLWLGLNPDSPAVYAVSFNHGVMAGTAGDLATARTAYERAIAGNPEFIQAYINLGNVLERQGSMVEALSNWQTAVDRLAPINSLSLRLKILALRQLGRVQQGHGRAAAENSLRQILELDPSESDVAEHYMALRLLQCKWPVLEPPQNLPRDVLLRSLHPLTAAAYVDHPLYHLTLNWNFNRRRIGYKNPVLPPRASEAAEPAARRLRIGYLSSDLCAHAVGYLIVEAMERHDHAKVETFVYYCGPPEGDWINIRIKAVTDCWVDINPMDDATAAARIQADGIDILVDLNGNTKGARTAICAMRPAPVIVNWLGFPGTMASPYHHYIIADERIIPPEYETYYSEKVIRLPCYQPNDRKRHITSPGPTREDARLPEQAMVYCCFNWSQKISPQIFSMWMDILRQVPDSVLWLLDTDAETNQHLARLAVERDVDGDRLIFGEWKNSADHLARYPLADLFLDTFPYGAHTTASDALWMGVPILTLAGRSFASRVCGSLSAAAGLPELVCGSPADYVRIAVELGHDRDRIRAYKEKLAAAHDSCVLFDTDLLVRRLEALYAEVWDDYRQGRLPCPDLRNLGVYLEAATEDDLDPAAIVGLADYDGWFRSKLNLRHQACSLPEDSRLWTEPSATP